MGPLTVNNLLVQVVVLLFEHQELKEVSCRAGVEFELELDFVSEWTLY